MKANLTNFLRHPLLSGSMIMIGGNMIVNATNYFYHLVMGRVLGPVNYGTLASLYSVLYIISIIPSSTSIAITKFISSAKDESEVKAIYHSIAGLTFYVALILSAVILILSPAISSFLHIGSILTVALVAPILFVSLVTLVNQATSQGMLRFVGMVGPNLVSAIVKLLVGIALVLIGWSVLGAMAGVFLGTGLAYLYSAWFVRGLSDNYEHKEYNLGKFLKYSLPVLAQALAFTSLFTIDVVLAKHFLSPFEAGLYAALSTLGKIIYFAAAPITGTMFPIVSRRKAKSQNYLKVFIAALLITIFLSLLIVSFYYLFPNLAIGILYGKAYLSAKPELVWMGAFIFFYTLSFFLVNFMLSLGRTEVVVLPLIAALVQVGLIWVWHGNIREIIQISLIITLTLFIGLAAILVYNFVSGSYEQG